jgi:hypothetical protein
MGGPIFSSEFLKRNSGRRFASTPTDASQGRSLTESQRRLPAVDHRSGDIAICLKYWGAPCGARPPRINPRGAVLSLRPPRALVADGAGNASYLPRGFEQVQESRSRAFACFLSCR